jgi:hypothetical protein
MSRTLSLIRAGWESIRAAADRGRRAEALAQLVQVLARPDLPSDLAPDAHRLAGELALDLSRNATARRQLRAAAALEPEHANTWFQMGLAWEEDPDGCDRRAAICFKKAVARDAANPLYRAAFGRAAARCGKVGLGTREMIAAANGSDTDPSAGLSAIRIAVGGLLEAGRIGAARRVLAKARFLRPGNTELLALWERLKFESARHAQLKQKQGRADGTGTTHAKPRYAQDAHFAMDGDRVTIPFAAAAGKGEGHPRLGGAGGTIRRDGGSFPRPHLARLHARKADR